MTKGIIESFEVTQGGISGDLISEKRPEKKLLVGVLTCAYFEYWRMYRGLQSQVKGDMRRVADGIAETQDIVYPGLVDTLDKADEAGRLFRDRGIDLLVITEGTYSVDYLIHQVLVHLSEDIPLCLFAAQVRTKLDFNLSYDQSLRNSGAMGIVQLSAGFRKMDRHRHFEVVVGCIGEKDSYREIDRFIQVRTTISHLRRWNIGLVGHVFRGMYDFQYDKTSVSGKLGPHVIDIDIGHLIAILEEISDDDERVLALKNKVHAEYRIVDLEEIDILRSARLAVGFQELVRRYRLDGMAVLGQHHIEKQSGSTCHLGLSELLANDEALAVTEGDVLGLIMSKVLKDFTGVTPFFGEWEDIDTSLNAIMMLGHGFIDPRAARKDREVQVQPACEEWGFEGNSMGFEATYPPGPVTMTHVIEDARGWRLLISEGEILDTPPLKINECSLVVRVEKDVKQFLKGLIKLGFAHHAIIAPGKVADKLQVFAEQLDLEICRL